MEPMSAEARKALTDCFKYFDKSEDGVIDGEELPEALRFAGINPSKEDVALIIKPFDSNGDGKLQIEELVDNWNALCQHSVKGKELLKAFNKLDTDHDGFIKIDELARILMKTGEKWTLKEAAEFCEIMNKYDVNCDGKFSYAEFVALWTSDDSPMTKPT